MKVNSHPNSYNQSFQAGMTMKFANEIKNANIADISGKFAKLGIENDFKDNKIVAWCSNKTLEIFKQLNQKYGLKFGLPKGIFVEDFNKLRIDDSDILAFNLFLPCRVKQGSDKIFTERNLFFNDKFEWKFIDELGDLRFKNNESTNSNFIDLFTHEFSHSAHSNNLLKKLSNRKYVEFIDNALNEKLIADTNDRHAEELTSICNYAKENFLEAIGCDLSGRVVESLDKNTLLPRINSFADSPYKNLSLIQKLLGTEPHLNQLLRNFWNGKLK